MENENNSAPSSNTRAAKRRRDEMEKKRVFRKFEDVRVSLKRITNKEIRRATKSQNQNLKANSFNVLGTSERENDINNEKTNDSERPTANKRKRTSILKPAKSENLETKSSGVTDNYKRTTRSNKRLLTDKNTPNSKANSFNVLGTSERKNDINNEQTNDSERAAAHKDKRSISKPGKENRNRGKLQEFIDDRSPVHEFVLNEIVLATVPGYAPWPSRIIKIVGETIFVEFFGTGQM